MMNQLDHNKLVSLIADKLGVDFHAVAAVMQRTPGVYMTEDNLYIAVHELESVFQVSIPEGFTI